MTDNHGSAPGSAPERLGEYVLERRLGSGGMGVVYLARTVAGRQLAIKVIRREYAEDPGFRARFRREVAAARRVSGAFTAPVVDADPEGDPPWLATLYVPGGSLADRIAEHGPLPAREAARVGAQLAEALTEIHGHGLVHRDLKPGNVLLAEDGVRVIDFGITRALSDSHRLTEDGAVLGSPPFMAPEQLTGGAEVSTPADVFALGAVVAFAATGHSPFEAGGLPGGDPLAVAYRVVHEEPDLGDVPPALRDLVSMCLAKDPDRRPAVASLLRMASFADTRAQAAVVRDSEVWRSARRDDDGGSPPAGRRRSRRWRRRLAVGAATLAVLAAAGAGVLLAADRGDGGADPDDGSAPGPSADAPTAPAFTPWEVDWRDFGVQDAAIAGLACAPAAAGDLLCSAGSDVTVLLAPDGTERWRHLPPRDSAGGPGALMVGEVVYAPSDKGLVALDLASGDELWEIDAPELMNPTAATEDSLVLQNGDSTLRFYALGSPDPVGSWEVPGRYLTNVLADRDRNRVLALSRAESEGFPLELTLLDGTGREQWPTSVGPPPEVAGLLEPVGIDAEAAYFEEWDPDVPVVAALHRLDLSDRSWSRTTLDSAAEPRTVVADGIAYANDTAGGITAVDMAAGEVRWSVDLDAETTSALAVAGDALYFSDGDGRLHQVAVADGTRLAVGEPHPGTPGAGSDAWAPPPVVTDDGLAYVVTIGNTLYATRLDELG
ncbi:protein kinase domain-containing protein [Streptomyces hainanensis]|nr:serine/threonine-protein kinase [Streptomyces hainanensis]